MGNTCENVKIKTGKEKVHNNDKAVIISSLSSYFRPKWVSALANCRGVSNQVDKDDNWAKKRAEC